MLFRFGARGALSFPKAFLREQSLKASGKAVIPMYWFFAVRNWGDLVGPYIVERITGATPVPAYSEKAAHLITVGSILSRSTASSVVWGSGFISSADSLQAVPAKISAVRGRYSSESLDRSGVEPPDVLGDPAMLMPRFYQPSEQRRQYRVGIVPHYTDLPLFKGVTLPGDVALIDIRQDVEPFIDELLTCETILSSSLHGLIAADAYGIPNHWVEFSGNLVGSGFKFNDYYSSLDEPDAYPETVLELANADWLGLASLASLHKGYAMGEALLEAFPWK
ncbi:polysaccharide pyruvyl transferase family protein [Marinobacter daepoensis]|uniref:polysaccharide pyruvyl transferase family protein n=1 Tax=Marinobacter daepoensis TaxID=262077 RepID=UPI000686A52C|nr:polysaccharide pyruvyl transferase family protein [Marinobacter daepoensis]